MMSVEVALTCERKSLQLFKDKTAEQKNERMQSGSRKETKSASVSSASYSGGG